MITYKQQPHRIEVRLDGKLVGYIEAVKRGYAYFPKNARKFRGLTYVTIDGVKLSVEGELL